MKIIRYSLTGFKPQYQSEHLQNVHLYLADNFSLKGIPVHLHNAILEQHKILKPFYQENYADFEYGIWAFIKGYKCNQCLNHLKKRVPCWEADIDDNTIVYHANWDRKMLITDDLCKVFGFYIPANQLRTLKEDIYKHDTKL